MTPKTSTIIEASILVIICTFSIFGNITLFFILTRRRALRTIANGFLLNLAFADLLVSVFNMPITVVTIVEQRWIFGDKACNILGFTTMLSFVSSVMSLAMIAISRYYYVVQWKSYPSIFTPKRSVIFAAIVWLISFLLSLPPLFGWAEYRYIPGKSYCFVFWRSDVYYMYFMLIICFFGPLTVVFVSYFNILKFTRDAKRRVNRHSENTKSQEEAQTDQGNNISVYERKRRRFKMTQEEVKITNTLLIIVACFIGCWAPFAITMFIDVYSPHSLPRLVDISTLLLGYANSMCNPVVYGIRNQAFRRELYRLYTRCCALCPKPRRVSAEVRSAARMDAIQAPDQVLDASGLWINASSNETNTFSSSKLDYQVTEITQIAQEAND
ncbi:hypothetical protein ACROYT_G007799 [Oculina patagonica]